MYSTSIPISSMKKLAEMVLEDIKKELRAQGHYDTGALEESMKPYAAGMNNETVIQAYAADYINELEHGVPANKIQPLSKSEFDDLRGWVMRKIGASTAEESTAIASAIWRKWKKEGKPLSGSVAYSETGLVKHAIELAHNKNEDRYVNHLDDTIADSFDKIFLEQKSETI